MNLQILKKTIDWASDSLQYHSNQTAQDIQVGIVVKTAGSAGATPTVNIKSISLGFDWDNGKLLVFPEKDLRLIEADELAALRKENTKQGWAEYENRNLKAEVSKLKKKIQNLEMLTKAFSNDGK